MKALLLAEKVGSILIVVVDPHTPTPEAGKMDYANG